MKYDQGQRPAEGEATETNKAVDPWKLNSITHLRLSSSRMLSNLRQTIQWKMAPSHLSMMSIGPH